ncbi:Uncharacterised protein [Mycobacteroides abscessus subsp. abscessus]|nr:peptidoglycan-binding 1 domain protein [Bordetella bronchiseptica]SHT53447.1 Uncharacterised protein [Mycobacteroides abscessus subsp. abscessus]
MDAARIAAAAPVQGRDGARRQVDAAGRAADRQAERGIAAGLGAVQRVQADVLADAAGQLADLGTGQPLGQLGLAAQHDLQEFLLAAFQVRQQPQQLQAFQAQVLGVVDAQDAQRAGAPLLQQKGVQAFDVVGRRAVRGQPEVLQDGRQQRFALQEGVEDQARLERLALGQRGQQLAQEGALAGADLAGQQDEALAAGQTVRGLGLARLQPFGMEVVFGVGRGRKGRRVHAQAPVRRIGEAVSVAHGRSAPAARARRVNRGAAGAAARAARGRRPRAPGAPR